VAAFVVVFLAAGVADAVFATRDAGFSTGASAVPVFTVERVGAAAAFFAGTAEEGLAAAFFAVSFFSAAGAASTAAAARLRGGFSTVRAATAWGSQ
jgi:hypothetical protein